MTEELNDIFNDFKASNEKTLNHLDNELLKVRAGKATPSMLHGVMVDYYGSPTPLQQVANISTLDARTISIQAWEKSMLTEIAK
ncbi:MAG TPA: ribosome recycling factor, partial [Taishania sp.]|nr:ribosome recycling factor [Taishania sp.]